MLTARFYGPLDIRMEDISIPQPAPGEVLVQIAAATTCGTDVKSYRRGHPLLFPHMPASFGHEGSGVVAAVGRDVIGYHEGDLIVAANSAPCQHCFYCRRHRFSLCEDLLFLNGTYAEYILVPERIVRHNMHHLPSGTSFVAAALTEPLACALHGVEESAIRPDDTVTILGSGPLGLLLAACARLRGARVIITGRGEERLALARHYGVDVVIDVSGIPLEEQRDAVRAQTDGGRGADCVIEAIGTPETWQLAASMVRPGGLVNFFGGCASGTQVGLDTHSLHYSEITMKGVFHHTPTYFAKALDLITSHAIDVEALVTVRYPLASTLTVLELLLKKQGVKYALIPPAFEQLLLVPAVPG